MMTMLEDLSVVRTVKGAGKIIDRGIKSTALNK